MKTARCQQLCIATALAACLCGWPPGADAQVQFVPELAPQAVFAGHARPIHTVWQNTNHLMFQGWIETRLLEASTTMVIPFEIQRWKQLRVLPGQTILESTALDFPAVRSRTKYIVQWLHNTNRVLGTTEVWVYPTNALDELKRLVPGGENNLGVFDPAGLLRPALKNSGLPFADLEPSHLEDFTGKLVLVGPGDGFALGENGLPEKIARLAQKGVPVVWIQPPPPKRDWLWPSYFTVPAGQAAVVVVDPGVVSDLTERPESQQNLIFLCKLAMNPPAPALPALSAQP